MNQPRLVLPLVIAFAALLNSAFAQNRAHRFVYLAEADSQAIAAYSLDLPSGALIPVAGSPFRTGARPLGVAVDPTDRFVYVVNAGSEDVSAFSVDSTTGALRPVAGSPFAAGTSPSGIAVDPTGEFLYVVNSGSNDVSAYRIDAVSGALTMVPGSPFAAGVVPTAICADPQGRFVYVANSAAGTLSVYKIGRNGALTPAPGSPFSAGVNPDSITVDPTGRFVYLAGGGAVDGKIWGFGIDETSGEIKAIPGSPFAAGAGAVSIAVHPAAKFVYAANGSAISTFDIDVNTGALTPSRNHFAPQSASSRLMMDRAGAFLYSADGDTGEISAYAVDHLNGNVAPAARSPFTSPSTPVRRMRTVDETPASRAVSIAATNAVAPSGTPLVTGFTAGPAHNDFNGLLGMQFTVGSTALNVTALGRICIASNSGSHLIKLVRASDKVDVPGGSVTLNMAGCTAGDFAYAALASPVTLSPSTAYLLVSAETAGGDVWYQLSPLITTTVATINGGAVYLTGIGYQTAGVPNNGFVPVNLLYAAGGPPPTVSISAPNDGAAVSGNNVAVTATATAAAGLAIKQVQFQVDGANFGSADTTAPYAATLDTTPLSNGTHTLTAIATDTNDTSTTSAGVTITVNNNPTVTITAPTNGATVSGHIPITATATAVPGLNIVSVQFLVDDVNEGAPVTSAPYTITLDVSTLSNAQHTLTAVARDSANNMVTSGPVTITVNNNVTTVAITSPTNGALVSGSIPVTATATPGAAVTIQQVQFKLDGADLGLPVTSAPYTTTLNTVPLSNGSHTLSAVAKDSANNLVTSSSVSITVSNAAPPPAGTALVTGFTAGVPHNDLTGGVGMQFTVGSSALNVIGLGRVYIDGNTGTHLLKLVRASDKADVPGGSVAVSMAGGTAGQFVYAQLAAPVTLTANTSYYLVSEETAGGDFWYALSPVTTTTAAAVHSGILYTTGIGYQMIGSGSFGYVPVNLLYTAGGPPPTVSITAPSDGSAASGNNVTVAATATAAAGLSIKQVQFQVDGTNIGTADTTAPYSAILDTTPLTNGTHTLTAIATDTGNTSATSAGVTITVNNNPAVAITTPASGATVSGSVPVTATATPVAGLNIISVQFKVDNVNEGAPVTTAPYTITLDASKLSNAQHTLTAVARDSANNMVTSAPVSITVNNNVTTVAITSPANGALVSGSIPVTAVATPGAAVTIQQVQFKLDGADLGSPVTSAPYTIALNTASLSNGAHILTAVAKDSSNSTATSSPVSVTVSNAAPPPSGTALVTGFTAGAPHNDLTGGVGMQFTVGSTAMNVIGLGRIYIDGNTGTHLVKLVRASDKVDVPGGSVTVNMAGGTAGQFVYAQLASPITLAPNTVYYLMSQETAGGDSWYALSPVTTTTAAAVKSGILYSTGVGYQMVGSGSFAYVPVNLLYTPGGPPPTVSITAPTNGSSVLGNNVAVTATATAGAGLSIKQVQFQVDGTNLGSADTTAPYSVTLDTTPLSNGTHTLTAIATDTNDISTTSTGVTITVNNNPTVTITTPVNGATVSGSVPVTATATPVPGLNIISVQFKVNNVNEGAAVTSAPYTITLDASKLSNAQHTLTAVARDSANNMVTSAPVTINVNNNVTTVTITSPSEGALVSGSIPVNATATPGASVTIQQVQFKLDNADLGSPVTTAPYATTLNTAPLSNGPHTLTAVAKDSSNNTVTSAVVNITVSNAAPPPSGAAFITGFTAGAPHNDVPGWLGMQFTVGPNPVTVTALGRVYITGNTGAHTVKLVRAGTKTDVPGASVTVNLAGGTAGQFVYAQLPSPVALLANTAYYLVSEEVAGGDSWYALSPVTTTGVATVNSGVVQLPVVGYQIIGSGSYSYVPVSLLYATGTT